MITATLGIRLLDKTPEFRAKIETVMAELPGDDRFFVEAMGRKKLEARTPHEVAMLERIKDDVLAQARGFCPSYCPHRLTVVRVVVPGAVEEMPYGG